MRVKFGHSHIVVFVGAVSNLAATGLEISYSATIRMYVDFRWDVFNIALICLCWWTVGMEVWNKGPFSVEGIVVFVGAVSNLAATGLEISYSATIRMYVDFRWYVFNIALICLCLWTVGMEVRKKGSFSVEGIVVYVGAVSNLATNGLEMSYSTTIRVYVHFRWYVFNIALICLCWWTVGMEALDHIS
ncbi:hypothetical protein AVEN_115811-1 [Araneus ventricosus]|uniref:Uncharacterized protein n=1 Tax=Araneus ventricosus TaxID=182803 RepID=A0A4Y2NJR0_ARAVE|nr:hypothetical protein AVEN_115811-1 [Araneus ventricosus]